MIDTEFLVVIAFRLAHNVAFEKSDLFFICMLRPVSSEIKIDDLEVQAAKWMALREFVEQPLIKGDNCQEPWMYIQKKEIATRTVMKDFIENIIPKPKNITES
ncbi:putative hydrolase [Helianthus debilis subsp. tardiflorus]